jgi:kynurenine 3-monooxygenase
MIAEAKSDRVQAAAGMATARIAIVGAGLAGSLLALALARTGHAVDVFERRPDPRLPDPRSKDGWGGRSINLGLSKRGMQALSMVGLLDLVLKRAVVMRGRVVHLPNGKTRFQSYGKNAAEVLHSIDRDELNRLLLDQAERHAAVTLHFGHRLVRANKERREIQFDAAGTAITIRPNWVVGADGAFSTMRTELQRGERASYSQEFLEWGYKELTLAPGPDGNSLIDLTALHVWPRNHCLCVSHPNREGSHTLTLFLPFDGEDSFASLKSAADLTAFMTKYFADLLPLLPGLAEEWAQHPVGALISIRTAPWAFGDWAVLVGDACHAVYPFYGQGMNSAFEDCCTLLAALDEHRADHAAAFHAYEQARRQHTDVLSELSKANFLELRAKIRSPWFAACKQLDLAFNRLWPNAWRPLYAMIAHSTMPYGEAVARARRQDRILLGSALGFGVILCLLVSSVFW